MATGIQEIKLAGRMQECSGRIAECRSSGMSVRAWCSEQGISVQTYYRWEKRFVEKATQQDNTDVLMPWADEMQRLFRLDISGAEH